MPMRWEISNPEDLKLAIPSTFPEINPLIGSIPLQNLSRLTPLIKIPAL
jgi:hypothetical protein